MANVKAIPQGYSTVTPSMTVKDAPKVIEFYKKAFDAKEHMRMPGPDGKIMHAEIQIGDSIIMLNDEFQEPAQPASLFLYVPDVDKTVAKAVKAGATVLMPPQDMFWGDRYGVVTDPYGHKWNFSTHVRDVTPEEMAAASEKFFSADKQKADAAS